MLAASMKHIAILVMLLCFASAVQVPPPVQVHPPVQALAEKMGKRSEGEMGGRQAKMENIDVAVCFSGLARTFAYKEVRDNMRDKFLKPFLQELSYRSFFVLGVHDDPRVGSPIKGFGLPIGAGLAFPLEGLNGESAVLENGSSVIGHFGRFDATGTLKKIKFWLEDDRSFARDVDSSQCPPPTAHRPWPTETNIGRWATMLVRHRNCFELVKDFERQKDTRFERVLFTRPDLLFVGPAPKLPDMSSDAKDLFIPRGVVQQTYNDHLAVCPRQRCDQYFDMLRTLESGSPIKLFKACNCHRPWQDHLYYSLTRSFDIVSEHLPYTLMRTCPLGAECDRLSYKYPLNKTCASISKAVCDHHQGTMKFNRGHQPLFEAISLESLAST